MGNREGQDRAGLDKTGQIRHYCAITCRTVVISLFFGRILTSFSLWFTGLEVLNSPSPPPFHPLSALFPAPSPAPPVRWFQEVLERKTICFFSCLPDSDWNHCHHLQVFLTSNPSAAVSSSCSSAPPAVPAYLAATGLAAG